MGAPRRAGLVELLRPGAVNAAGQNLTLSRARAKMADMASASARSTPGAGAHRAVGWPRQSHRSRHEAFLRQGQRPCSGVPLGRVAEADEVATLVAMLASPLMHMVNGAMIEIDGQKKSLMDRLRGR